MGQFATSDDVVDRYEGTFPSSRINWVDTRIGDVEAFLVGLVPSLESTTDPGRLARAKVLVCDKVLELYRNPDGSTNRTQTYGSMSDTRSFSRESSTGKITFTADELASVKAPRTGLRNLGSMGVAPWGIGR